MRGGPGIPTLGLLGLLSAWGGPAAAAGKAEIAVVGMHVAGQDDEQALQAAEQMALSLEKTGQVSPIEPGEVRGRLAGREELVVQDTFLGPGRRSLDEGRLLYDRADFDSAIPKLEQAVEALTDGLPGSKDSKDLIDALLLLGLAQAGIGQGDAARAAYKQVVVLDSARRLDPVRYAPKIVALFDEVREQVLALPKASLKVEAPGAGASVFVDGRRAGTTPATVENLPPGTHYVLVVAEDGHREFAKVELSPSQKGSYRATLVGRRLGDPGTTEDAREKKTRQLYRSLGTYADTDLILLGGELLDGRVGIQLYEPRTEAFSRAVAAEAGGDPVSAMIDLSPSLGSFISDDGTLRSDRTSPDVLALDLSTNSLLASILLDPEPIVQVETVTKGTPWYVWAGVAAVAAGGAAAAVIVLSDDGTPDPDTVDPDQGTVLVGPFP